MLYKPTRFEERPHRFVITNHAENYWLRDHVETYKKLSLIKKSRKLTDTEFHQYLICLRALNEHNLLSSYS